MTNISKRAVLAAIVFVAHFLRFRSFGFYEEDYAMVGVKINSTLSVLPNILWTCVTNLSLAQGRLISCALPWFIEVPLGQLGSLAAGFLVVFVIITINVLLLHQLLRKSLGEPIASLAALLYCLFPSDTTKNILGLGIALHTSATLFLLAANLYVSGRTRLSYVALSGVLLSYESFFFPFLAVPLLRNLDWNEETRKRLWRNLVVMLSMVACVLLLRLVGKETRLVELQSPQVLFLLPSRILGNTAMGGSLSLLLYLFAPLRLFRHWQIGYSWAILGVSALAMLALRETAQPLFARTTDSVDSSTRFRLGFAGFRFETDLVVPQELANALKGMLVGAVMLSLAYVASFTHFPALVIAGNQSAVHIAAGVGASLLVACLLIVGLATLGKATRGRLPLVGALCLYLGLLGGYFAYVQTRLADSWADQKQFWNQVFEVCPDLEDGTLIVVADDRVNDFSVTGPYHLSFLGTLDHFYQWPDSWRNHPRILLSTSEGVRDGTALSYWGAVGSLDGKPLWTPEMENKIKLSYPLDGNVILVQRGPDGRLNRKTGTEKFAGLAIRLKEPGSPLPRTLPKKPLVRFLFEK